jgi:hypothetical protein
MDRQNDCTIQTLSKVTLSSCSIQTYPHSSDSERLSNYAIQDTVAQHETERNCQECSELSVEIAKLTPTAASIVTRACADITAKHADAKKRVEDDFEALRHLWEDVFELFVAGVTKTISCQLETALATLNSAGRKVINSVSVVSPTVPKRKLSSASYLRRDPIGEVTARPIRTESNYVISGLGEDEFREGKRRRVTSSASQRGVVADDSKSLAANREADIFLQELKERLEMQARSLDLLTQENSEASPYSFFSRGEQVNDRDYVSSKVPFMAEACHVFPQPLGLSLADEYPSMTNWIPIRPRLAARMMLACRLRVRALYANHDTLASTGSQSNTHQSHQIKFEFDLLSPSFNQK